MESIAKIPLPYRLAISDLLSAGVIGWRKNALHQYQIYSLLMRIGNIVTRFGGGKPPKVSQFGDLFPVVAEMIQGTMEKVPLHEQVARMRDRWLGK